MNEKIKIATTEAMKSEMNFKHGAIVWNKKIGIVSKAHNRRVPKQRLTNRSRTLHAEVGAIIKAIARQRTTDLSDLNIMVIRKSKTKLSNSKPCKNCMNLIKETGIKNIYYSTTEGEIIRRLNNERKNQGTM